MRVFFPKSITNLKPEKNVAFYCYILAFRNSCKNCSYWHYFNCQLPLNAHNRLLLMNLNIFLFFPYWLLCLAMVFWSCLDFGITLTPCLQRVSLWLLTTSHGLVHGRVGILCLCAVRVCAVFFLLVPVCQVADPSQAYYQGVTEGGRQQRQCLNET